MVNMPLASVAFHLFVMVVIHTQTLEGDEEGTEHRMSADSAMLGMIEYNFRPVPPLDSARVTHRVISSLTFSALSIVPSSSLALSSQEGMCFFWQICQSEC